MHNAGGELRVSEAAEFQRASGHGGGPMSMLAGRNKATAVVTTEHEVMTAAI